MEYAKKAGKAIVLLIFRRFWTIIINFGVMAYLARILDKPDFGILAISAILISFSSTVGTGGVGEFLIYKKGDHLERYYQAAFWLNFLTALVTTVLIILLSPVWGDFYGDDRISTITIILAIRFFFSMLATVPNALFRKQLKFEYIVWATTVSYTVTSILKVLFAYFNFGVYSLALPELIVSPFLFIYLMYKSDLRIRFKFHIVLWGEIVRYSKGLIGARVVTKVANEGDTLLTGKFLGVASLGVYNLAFNVSNVFTNNILPIFNEVSYPLMAKLTDVNRLQRVYLKVIGSIAFLSFPLLIFFIVASENIVLIWYGSKWGEVILPLQILLVFTLSRSISSPSGGLFQVVGRNDLAFYNSVFNTICIILGVIFGATYGLIGICAGVTIARVLTGQYQIARAVKLIGLSYKIVLKELWPVFIVSLCSGFLALVFSRGISCTIIWVDAVVKFLVFGSVFIFLFRVIFTSYLVNYLFLLEKVYPALYTRMIVLMRLKHNDGIKN